MTSVVSGVRYSSLAGERSAWRGMTSGGPVSVQLGVRYSSEESLELFSSSSLASARPACLQDGEGTYRVHGLGAGRSGRLLRGAGRGERKHKKHIKTS